MDIVHLIARNIFKVTPSHVKHRHCTTYSLKNVCKFIHTLVLYVFILWAMGVTLKDGDIAGMSINHTMFGGGWYTSTMVTIPIVLLHVKIMKICSTLCSHESPAVRSLLLNTTGHRIFKKV